MKFYKIKAFWSGLKKALPFLMIFAVFLTIVCYPHETTEGNGEEAKRVVRVWNVDTFEGGKGSRTNFLKRAAAKIEKKDRDVFYLISSYTIEGANRAFAEGQRPDVLSFGIGVSAYLESSLPLPYSFAGGETDGGCYAYPWCRGEYYLFSLTDGFEKEGTVAVSAGGMNLVEVAAALNGLSGERIDSLSAYVAFLNGQYRYLLGTQRDKCRFASRGVEVYEKPLNEFCDLYQYISVLSAGKREDCLALVDMLLSDAVQGELESIGMLPVKGGESIRTVSAFSDVDSLSTIRNAASGEEPLKNLDKFLKNI